MDKRRTITFILISAILVTTWIFVTAHLKEKYGSQLDQPQQPPAATTPAIIAATSPSTEPSTEPSTNPSTNPSIGPSTNIATTAPTPSAPTAVKPAAEGTAVGQQLGSGADKDAKYAMLVRLSPQGAGIDSITL